MPSPTKQPDGTGDGNHRRTNRQRNRGEKIKKANNFFSEGKYNTVELPKAHTGTYPETSRTDPEEPSSLEAESSN